MTKVQNWLSSNRLSLKSVQDAVRLARYTTDKKSKDGQGYTSGDIPVLDQQYVVRDLGALLVVDLSMLDHVNSLQILLLPITPDQGHQQNLSNDTAVALFIASS